MLEEFQTYGYPMWVFKMVGAVKCSFASMLIASMIYPCKTMTLVGAGGMVFLMTVALVSHCKVKDELSKSIPALSMFTLATYILAFNVYWQGLLLEKIAHRAYWAYRSSSTALGIVVTVTCLYMWFRSYCNGDYNVENYANAREQGTYALLA